MKIRLGYVSIALNLPKVTASSTVTYTNYCKITSEEEKINKLKKVTLSNLEDLYTILKYNNEKNIHFYRITSNLVPLATHPLVEGWNYRDIFKKDFERIGKFIRDNNMRVDTHPDQFNVINSVRDEVVESTIKNLTFHDNLFRDISYPEGKMVLHVGGAQGGKKAAMDRFITNFANLPQEIKERMILENDDKTFTAKEVLHICKEIHIPMVLDIHHHLCNNEGEKIEDYIGEIFHTWDHEKFPPKVHISSPKEGPLDRRHADFINIEEFLNFMNICKTINRDLDIMIEAKEKDRALFNLAEEIRLKTNYKWEDETTFYI